MFNEDLLTQCRKPHFKRQHMDPIPLPEIINKKEEYKVEEIKNYRKQGYSIQFLVYWKEYGNEHDQYIFETGLPYAREAKVSSKKGVKFQNNISKY